MRMIKARVVKAVVMALPAMMLAVGGVGTALTVNGVLSTPAHAADKKSEKQLGTKVGKPLKEVLELAQQKKFKEAMAKLKEVQAIPGKTPFEEYKVNEIVAYVASNLGDSATVSKALEATLDSGELSPAETKQRLAQLTQSYSDAKNYPKAIQFGNRYIKEFGNDPNVLLWLVVSYYSQKDYPNTIDSVQNLIRTSTQAGQPVKKEWLEVLRDSQVNAGRTADAQATLEQLVAKYPSPAYWSTILVGIQNKGGNSDRKSLEIQRLKMVTNSLKDSDYVDMAQTALALGFPGDAKAILEKGFNSKILGNGASKDRETRLLNMAQEKSAAELKELPQFEKATAATPDSEDDLKIGETYVSYGQYDKGIEIIKRSLQKGNLKSEDEAQLQLGIAYYGAKRNSDAVAAFKAVPADSKLAVLARLWVLHVQSGK